MRTDRCHHGVMHTEGRAESPACHGDRVGTTMHMHKHSHIYGRTSQISPRCNPQRSPAESAPASASRPKCSRTAESSAEAHIALTSPQAAACGSSAATPPFNFSAGKRQSLYHSAAGVQPLPAHPLSGVAAQAMQAPRTAQTHQSNSLSDIQLLS